MNIRRLILIILLVFLCIISISYNQEKAFTSNSQILPMYINKIMLSIIPIGFLTKKKRKEDKNDKVPKSFLIDLSEDGNKKRYTINKVITTIGRLPSDKVDICINKNTVSTLHAQILYKNHAFYILDLGSTNGTYLNDKEERINNETRLRSGDTIILDQYKFQFIVSGHIERSQKKLGVDIIHKTPVRKTKASNSLIKTPEEDNSDTDNTEEDNTKEDDIKEKEQKLSIPEAFLIDVNSATNKNMYKVNKTITKIGRMQENDVYINKTTVSALHAQIEYKDDGFYLTDNNSANGTYLNEGKQRIIREVRLKGEDIIYFDQYKFRFLM
jgi:pSer/pThr/pTyr-binding forkhead associated (FHA) protein